MGILGSPDYLSFPFQIDPATGAPQVGSRQAHIREQIEQVLFTNPGERVFRPGFGAGARALVFEPNSSSLWELTRKRLTASLSEALRGEVDPRTLEISVEPGGHGEQLVITIRYELTTLGHSESHTVTVGGGATDG